MISRKQDLNGVRTPEDVERRYKLGAISGLEDDVDELKQDIIIDDFLSSTSTHPVQNKIITAALGSLDSNKVDKVSGKGLSSNDFTDEDKTSIHTHSNKSILDTITQAKINQWDANSNSDVYSTTETLTNITVEDENGIERNVYRTCIYVSSLPNAAGRYLYNHNISSVNSIWINTSKSYIESGDSQHNPITWIHPDTISSGFTNQLDGSITIDAATSTTFRINVGKDRSSFSAFVVLEYTKTS